ncbi:unnamed protein product [Durusdinium trenchii]|uniref:RAB6-interacting golgin n=1 Tax=Durusdinium trenchii TaxID=1381693 RepID=A0ABP0JVJ5_9DINO
MSAMAPDREPVQDAPLILESSAHHDHHAAPWHWRWHEPFLGKTRKELQRAQEETCRLKREVENLRKGMARLQDQLEREQAALRAAQIIKDVTEAQAWPRIQDLKSMLTAAERAAGAAQYAAACAKQENQCLRAEFTARLEEANAARGAEQAKLQRLAAELEELLSTEDKSKRGAPPDHGQIALRTSTIETAAMPDAAKRVEDANAQEANQQVSTARNLPR